MWDKPEYLKRIADALFVLALLGVLYAVLIYALHQPIFNIRLVRIVTPIDHVTQSQIEEIIRREVRGSLFTLNLIAVRSGFEKLPW
jgi:cell division protein FtsQ